MRIHSINNNFYNGKIYNTNKNNNITNPTENISDKIIQNMKYNNLQGYVNFKQRLPEDFYEYNKDRLPETMKVYLKSDYTERSKIAPVQIMSEAYDDLSIASTVEDIKELYPNEPLFQKLHNANYQNASSEGILKSIANVKKMQEHPEPLFKDGSDDLTTYIVKKIFLEGKTIKEIDKDFEKDINAVYELAAKKYREKGGENSAKESIYFSNSTTYHLGIRFPDVAFWNSFIATRNDYERTKRIKINGKFENANKISSASKSSDTPKLIIQKRPKYKFTKSEAQRLATKIANSSGNVKKTIKDSSKSEELTFLQKYWSEIMSVVAEKIHLSEELMIFNSKFKSQTQKQLEQQVIDDMLDNQGANSTNKEREILQAFWNSNNKLKTNFSLAITDTMMLFKEADEEGEEELNRLLEYARSIKPYREADKVRYAVLQEQYDDLGKRLMEEEQTLTKVTNKEMQVEADATPVTKPNVYIPDYELHFKHPEDYDYLSPQIHDYEIDGVKIRTPINLQQTTLIMLLDDYTLLPKQYVIATVKDFEQALGNKAGNFYLTCCTYNMLENPEGIKDLILNEDELQQIISKMSNKYKTADIIDNAKLALFRYLLDYTNITNDQLLEIRHYIPQQIIRYMLKLKINDTHENMSQTIQNNYDKYNGTLTKKEQTIIKSQLLKLIYNTSTKDTESMLVTDDFNNEIYSLILADICNSDSKMLVQLGKDMVMGSKILDKYNNVGKLILDPTAPQLLKDLGIKYFLYQVAQANRNKLSEILEKDIGGLYSTYLKDSLAMKMNKNINSIPSNVIDALKQMSKIKVH